MAGTMVSLLRKFPLKFNREVLDGAGDVHLEFHTHNPDLIRALQENKVPKPEKPIVIGEADINVEDGRTLALGSGGGKVGRRISRSGSRAVAKIPLVSHGARTGSIVLKVDRKRGGTSYGRRIIEICRNSLHYANISYHRPCAHTTCAAHNTKADIIKSCGVIRM